MKKRVIAVIAVLALSVAMFGCKAGSDTGNGKKQREESAGDMGTEGKATAEEETEIQVFIAASLNTVMTELDNCFFMAMEDNVDMRFNDVQFAIMASASSFCAELSFLPYPLLQAGVPGLLYLYFRFGLTQVIRILQ